MAPRVKQSSLRDLLYIHPIISDIVHHLDIGQDEDMRIGCHGDVSCAGVVTSDLRANVLLRVLQQAARDVRVSSEQ